MPETKKIKISMIVAVAKNGTIGHDGDMPWRLSTDLKRFKEITMGCPVIMGRKTFQSVGRPLPGRQNIIVSRNGFMADNTLSSQTIAGAIELATEHALKEDKDEIFIIGGGQVYLQSLDLADKIYLTHVEAEIEGDTVFPNLDSDQWNITYEIAVPAGEKDSHPTRLVIYERSHT